MLPGSGGSLRMLHNFYYLLTYYRCSMLVFIAVLQFIVAILQIFFK